MSLFDDVLKELQQRAAVHGPDANGDYLTFCPFHQDKQHPNLFLHPQRGFHCFACGAKGSLGKLAIKLGIRTPRQTRGSRLSWSQAIQKLLRERCLHPKTPVHFHVATDDRKQAYRYPVEGGFRYKAYSSNAKMKYWHDKGVQNQLYGLADIADGTKEIWLVNGEPAVWQCWQAEIPAVCGIYGEGQLPEDTVDQLKARGVELVNVVFDLDTTGKKGSKAVWAILRHKFTVIIRMLPTDLGKGGDVGDLFTRCNGDETTFKQALGSLPQADTEGWEDEALKAQIDLIRTSGELEDFEQRRLISHLVITNLKSKGFLINTGAGDYFWFHDKLKRLFPIDSAYFLSLVEQWYGLNASEPEYRYLAEALRTEVELNGRQCEVYRFARYQEDILFVSRFDGQVYRLDGDSIELVPNGKDNIIFYDDPEWQSYEYLTGENPHHLYSLLIDPINFTGKDVGLAPEEQKVLWQLWLYCLFFESELPTKPILLFLGEKGSGKTSTLRWVLKWLFGTRDDVHSLAKQKEDAFITVVTSSYLAAFDQVDGRIPWLQDHLAALSTGTNIALRKLYTTNQKVLYHPRVFLALASRTPQFKRDDVVDRLLLFRVERFRSFKSERRLLQERLEARNELWTEVLNDLNQIVKALKENQESLTGNYRLADWAELSWKIAKIQGIEQEFLDIASKLETEKSTWLLEDDPLYLGLELWLNDPANEGKEVDIQTLFTELKKACENHDTEWFYNNTKSLASRISRIKSNLQDFFEVNIRLKKQRGQRNVYSFKRR